MRSKPRQHAAHKGSRRPWPSIERHTGHRGGKTRSRAAVIQGRQREAITSEEAGGET